MTFKFEYTYNVNAYETHHDPEQGTLTYQDAAGVPVVIYYKDSDENFHHGNTVFDWQEDENRSIFIAMPDDRVISVYHFGKDVVENQADYFEKLARQAGFEESGMRSEVSSNTKRRKTSVGLWLGKEKTNITMTVKSHVNIVLEGEFEEYGAIEGKLETLDAHDKYQFAIYEPLHLKKIVCTVDNDEVFTRAYELFGQRVEAEGYIKYTATGIPYEITVDRFNPIPEIMEKHSYKSTRGILKEYI